MKQLLLIMVSLLFLNGAEFYQAEKKMSWSEGVRYCFSLGSRLPSIDQIEEAFRVKNIHFTKKYYWTRTDTNMDGAYSFDFELGLGQPDHDSKKYNIMCVK